MPHFLMTILVSMYIGFEKITRDKKQIDNWKSLIDSFTSDYFPVRRKIVIADWYEGVKTWISESRLYEISEDFNNVIINKKKYSVLFDKIYTRENKGESIIIVPIIDELGIVYYHKVKADEKVDIENLMPLEKYLKKCQLDRYSTLLINEYNSMSKLEKLKFHLFNKK